MRLRSAPARAGNPRDEAPPRTGGDRRDAVDCEARKGDERAAGPVRLVRRVSKEKLEIAPFVVFRARKLHGYRELSSGREVREVRMPGIEAPLGAVVARELNSLGDARNLYVEIPAIELDRGLPDPLIKPRVPCNVDEGDARPSDLGSRAAGAEPAFSE